LFDRRARRTECISLTSGGTSGDSDSYRTAISADGRFVAFLSFAGNLVPGDTNDTSDIFVRDRVLATTERVRSVGVSGQQGNSYSDLPALSADGRFVAFNSRASNLVPGDLNNAEDVFVRDRANAVTELVSVSTSGSLGNERSTWPCLSTDGRCVVFTSASTNLVDGEQNLDWDVFVRDRLRGTTECVSRGLGGHAGNEESGAWGSAVSGDGRFVAYYSYASNLVPDDTNTFDLFVHDRDGGTIFTSLCEPGVDGVLPCPCGNPPNASGRGCDNSAGTGGAALIAAGGTFLSSDSLTFTTRGEVRGAVSVVYEASSSLAGGAVFGQGVRCVQGALRALYTKSAADGGIRAPDLDGGETTVTKRSAQKGDRISAGEHRFYFVSYRDPIVLGSCPAASTFNATQAGEITWAP
jgi:Tol biopolymer transport system component